MVVITLSATQIGKIYQSESLDMVGIGSVRGAVIAHLINFCVEHCQGSFKYHPILSGIDWKFADPKDAMLFKLTWL